MSQYSYDEWNILPHIILISHDEQDPTILDYNLDDGASDKDQWYNAINDTSIKHNETLLDTVGRYKYRYIIHSISINSHEIDNGILPNDSQLYDTHKHHSYNKYINEGEDIQIYTQGRKTIPHKPDYKSIMPHFACQSVDTAKDTFFATT